MILLIMIMTPGIPEYLTGSSRFGELFLNPLSFFLGLALNIGLYSTGALLIREFYVRFNKGWTSVLMLGAAYGIMEEGISVHTFFQSAGNPVGLLAVYGRYIGVNWVWALGLTVFHAVFSIALPLLILAIAYPEYSRDYLLGRRGVSITLSFYLLTVLVLNLFLRSVRPDQTPTFMDYVFFTSVSLFLVLAGYIHAARKPVLRGKHTTGVKKFFFMGLSVFPLYALYAFVPVGPDGAGLIPPFLDMILYIFSNLGVYRIITQYMPPENNRKHLLYLVSGLVAPLLSWAVLMEFVGSFPFIVAVVIIAIVFLLRLRKTVRLQNSHNPLTGNEPPFLP